MGKSVHDAASSSQAESSRSVVKDAAGKHKVRSRGAAATKQPQLASSCSKGAKLGAVVKCARCGVLSSHAPWHQTEQLVDKRGASRDVPVGTACQPCGSNHEEGFGYMQWEKYAKDYNENAIFKQRVDESERVSRGGPKSFEDNFVAKKATVELEVRTPVVMLTEADLKKEMTWNRLPKNLNSIPQIKVPKKDALLGSTATEDDEQDNFETFFCFRDPSKPYREGSLVERFGVSISQKAIGKQIWSGQGQAVASNLVMDQSELMNLACVSNGFQKIDSLGEFKSKRSSTAVSRRRLKLAPALVSVGDAGDDQDDGSQGGGDSSADSDAGQQDLQADGCDNSSDCHEDEAAASDHAKPEAIGASGMQRGLLKASPAKSIAASATSGRRPLARSYGQEDVTSTVGSAIDDETLDYMLEGA